MDALNNMISARPTVHTAVVQTNNKALPDIETGFWEFAMANWYYLRQVFLLSS